MLPFQLAQGGLPAKKAAPAQEFSRSQMQSAVREAGKGLDAWLYAKSAEFSKYGRPITVVFGPSPYCYRYRLQTSEFPPSDGVGATTPEKLAQEMKTAAKHCLPISERDLGFAKKWGVPVDGKKAASEEENRALFIIHAKARLRDGKENGRVYAAKHLFEQSSEFENTEFKAVSYPSALPALQACAARNFSDLLLLTDPPPALMAGHAAYPVAEKELRETYPSIPSILPSSSPAPISLSPHFLRGFVRQGMGFSGIIISDAAGMGATRDFFKAIRPSLPEEMRALSHKALFFALSVYSGVNLPLYTAGPTVKKEVRKICESNAGFRELFGSLALESLFLKLSALDSKNPLVAGLSLPDLSAPQQALPMEKQAGVQRLKAVFREGSDEFEAKFTSIASYDSRMPENRPEHAGLPAPVLLVLERFSETTDLWNRTGVINMEFRRRMLESLTGREFPEPGKFATEASWLSALFSDKSFVAVYNQIDWNGAGMRAIFSGYCAELTGVAPSKIERMKPLVPRKIE